jgi:hypothetical protein
MNKQDNGNPQLNSLRDDFNKRVDRKLILGNSKRITWNSIRRHRTI